MGKEVDRSEINKDDRSTRINSSVTDSPISRGEFGGPVTYDYGQQQQLAEKAGESKIPQKPLIFRGETPIFVGRKEDIAKIKQLFAESKNAPV
jgi:hypothetical protein